MTVGVARTYYQKWRFKVLVDGIEGEAYFTKAGPLEVEVGVAEYKGGGTIVPHKEAASATFPAITLERGATEDQHLYNWLITVVFAAADSGLNQGGYKRNMTIIQMDRSGVPVKWYKLYECFIKKFTAGDWDGSSDEFNMESVEVEYDHFDLTTIPNPLV